MSLKHFRNVRVYRLTEADPENLGLDLGTRLAEHRAGDIGRHARFTYGFVPPMLPDASLAVDVSKRGTLITLLVQEKILPASVIKDTMAAKVQETEKQEDRTLTARERRTIREEVEFDLLPQAFVKKTRVNALISPPYIFVDTSSAPQAELLLKRLREAVGRLPCIPFSTKHLPSDVMTRWLLDAPHDQPESMSVGEKFKSKARFGETQTLSGNGMNLSHDAELQGLLSSNSHEVIEMQLVTTGAGDERPGTQFTLTEKLVLKGIQWPGELATEASDAVGEDADAITSQRAVLLLIEAELHKIVGHIAVSFGGELLPEDKSKEDERV